MADFIDESGDDESGFVFVSSNPQGDLDETTTNNNVDFDTDNDNDNLDVLSEFSLTSESEDERQGSTRRNAAFASPSLMRRAKKAEKREKRAARRPSASTQNMNMINMSLRPTSPDPALSRHRQLSHSKRAASAPCRVPLTSLFGRSRARSSLATLPGDSDTDASETSVPAPFTAGALSSNPNDLAAVDTPHSALLRNRVDRIRAMKLDGSIVSYIDRRSRQGKSIVEKVRSVRGAKRSDNAVESDTVSNVAVVFSSVEEKRGRAQIVP